MMSDVVIKDLVLVGGGHAHVHVLKMMGMKPMPGVRVTLITKDTETPYSGMIPGFVAGYYTKEQCHIDLGKLCSWSKARLILAEVNGVDKIDKKISFADGRPQMSYDLLSINIGITPMSFPGIQQPLTNIVPVKPITGFSERWDYIVEKVAKLQHSNSQAEMNNNQIKVVVVGAGAGGVELAFAMHHRFYYHGFEEGNAATPPNSVKITLVSKSSTLLSSHNKRVQAIVKRLLDEKNIEVLYGKEVVNVEMGTGQSQGNQLVAADGCRISYDEVIWCTNAAAQPWLFETGLTVTEEGFICVSAALQSLNCTSIFAVGDVAHLTESPRPKSGVFAVRAGPPLLANLRHALLQEPLERWEPQVEFLGIFGTGDRYAVSSKGPVTLEGKYVWDLKEHIDLVWMKQYQELPVMVMETPTGSPVIPEPFKDQATIDLLSHATMRCGGCGSKVGATVLSRALDRVRDRIVVRDDVVSGPGDDAALLLPPVSRTTSTTTSGTDKDKDPILLVQTIDYFRSFISDPYTFGQIAANHALSDIHAMNGNAVSCMALCVVPYGKEDKVEDTLVHVLAGACDVLKKDGCALVGGHTSEGADLAFGLAVYGTCQSSEVLRKGPPKVGDAVILTKAIGTGIILAADMRGLASGKWVDSTINSMLQSNRPAASILAKHGCEVCTDVTGFGVMGHLIEMLKYQPTAKDSEPSIPVKAKIDLFSVPLLPGASDCVDQGVASSLHPENIRSARGVSNVVVGRGINTYPLLFDPQTAGGLLATVPMGALERVLADLVAAGYPHASCIGVIEESLPNCKDSEYGRYYVDLSAGL